MTKAQAQRLHAKRRADERYGLTLNRAALEAMAREIRAGRSTPLGRQTHRTSLHLVTVDGETVRVVYDRNRKTIVTCLPRP